MIAKHPTPRPAPTPPAFDLVELRGGPYHGQRFRVRRGCSLSLTTRPKTGPGDRPPCALYAAGTAAGTLNFVRILGADPR